MTQERPILFNGAMVRAAAACMKTRTRRAMNERHASAAFHAEALRVGVAQAAINLPGEIRCLYGAPGDLLWVRETFFVDDLRYLSGPLTEAASRVIDRADIYYRADGECCAQIPECQCSDAGKVRWRPSIHMPRWASRITLRVTSVRVERVQDISEEDARAEGVYQLCGGYCAGDADDEWCTTAREAFRLLWIDINGRESWHANPWVWVIGFERIG